MRLRQAQAVVVWKGKFLLLKKKDLLLKKSVWRLVKGKLEKGETARTGLKRELREETGLKKIKIAGKIHSYDYEAPKGVFRKVETFLVEAKEKPRMTAEGRHEGISAITLVTAKQALAGLHWPAEKKVLAKAKTLYTAFST